MKIASLPFLAAAVLLVSLPGCAADDRPGRDGSGRAPSAASRASARTPVEEALEPFLALRRTTVPASSRPDDRVNHHEIAVEGCTVIERIVHTNETFGFRRDRTDRADLSILDTATLRVEPQRRTPKHDVLVFGVDGVPAMRWEARFVEVRNGRPVHGSATTRAESDPDWQLVYPDRETAVRSADALRRAITLCRAKANPS